MFTSVDDRRPVAVGIQSIDQIFRCFLLPLLKFPILLCLPFWAFGAEQTDVSKTVTCVFAVLTLLIQVSYKLNTAYKQHFHSKKWHTLHDRAFTVVITGGSSGLGLALVKKIYSTYIQNGNGNFKIIIMDKNVPSHDVVDKRGNIIFIQHDFANSSGILEDLCSEIISEHGPLDILINNVGMRHRFKSVHEHTLSEMETIFQVNVFSGLQLVNHLQPSYLVNIASVLGLVAPVNASSYAATKSALIAFHESWVQEQDHCGLLVLSGQLKNTAMFEAIEPPKQFFAPLVDPELLAFEIVKKMEKCESGEIYEPLYTNFIPLLRLLPFSLVNLLRKISGIDNCIEL